jgi:hypothetical protein
MKKNVGIIDRTLRIVAGLHSVGLHDLQDCLKPWAGPAFFQR